MYSQSTQALTDSWVDEIAGAPPKKAVCLYSLNDSVKRIVLDGQDDLTFGRLSFPTFTAPNVDPKKVSFFSALSKDHFVISRRRDASKPGCDSFILRDASRFGTYVNNKLVPSPKKEVTLQSGDTIGLHQRFPLFLFFDENDSLSAQFPAEVTNHYVVARKLGAGACGEVFLVYERGSGADRRFALKCVSKRKFGLSNNASRVSAASPTDKVKTEVLILRALSHPCVVELERCIETDDMLYIVMEYVPGGELFDHLLERIDAHRTGFPEPVAKVIFFQLLHAVEYLHSHSVIHRDLKPENVLLFSSSEDMTRIKLTDFGLSKMLDANTMLRTFCGTPQYVAPEVIRTGGDGEYSPAIDSWSLGVMLFVMLGGYPPFTSERQDFSLRDQILKGAYSFPDEFWQSVSENAKDLIRQLLTVDPLRRLTPRLALKHAWFEDASMKKKVSELIGIPVDQLLPSLDAATNGKQDSTKTIEASGSDPTPAQSKNDGPSSDKLVTSETKKTSGESITDSDSLGDLRKQFAISRIATAKHTVDGAKLDGKPVVQTRARTRARAAETKRSAADSSTCPAPPKRVRRQ